MSSSLNVTSKDGKKYDIAVEHGAVKTADLRKIRLSESEPGVFTYDPGLVNTATAKSSITYVDGDHGILRYRGYPIEELAETHSYLDVAYLVIYGELPTKSQSKEWVHNITYHTMVHENIQRFFQGFNHDAHPMGMLISSIAALSTFYPDSKNIFDPANRQLQIHRLIGKVPTLAALSYRHLKGLPPIYPNNDLDYASNFLNMTFRTAPEMKYEPDPKISKALDVLFILHADHEQNCSTNVMEAIGSSNADPYVAAAGAAGALYGPLHGGANEQVVRMLQEIGTKEKIPQVIGDVKAGKRLLMGFGHRVYKSYDPRAKIIKKIADEVFEVTGRNPLLDIALELERIALDDPYFKDRRLYPNVDFYSGLIYQAMGFPTDMFTVLFAVARTSGWMAHFQEMLTDPEQKLVRPTQIYTGYDTRHVPPV